jgi:uncharacterized protein (DUF302 family)
MVMKYYFEKTISVNFEQAIQLVTEELKKEGFGVLTVIDIKEKFREKLGVDFRKYKILGACNPAYAYKALQKEDKIGVMLPCNVIVQETAEGKTEVAAVDPVASMSAINNPELLNIAGEIQKKLKNVIEKLE